MEHPDQDLTLAISDAQLTHSRLDLLTREITVELNRQRGVMAGASQGEAPTGAKGEPTAVGVIAMKLLGSGGVAAVLMNTLKGYFLRKQTLVIDVKRKDGTKFTLRAENLSEQRMAETTTQLLKFLKA